MYPFHLSGRLGRPAAGFRTRLSVLTLDDRAVPGSLWPSDPTQQPYDTAPVGAIVMVSPTSDGGGSGYSGPALGEDPSKPADAAPIIVNFRAIPIGSGQYMLTGQVLDESPGGLVVTFGGVPSAVGKSATTNSDGTFEFLLQVQTDGTDTGTITAVTQDAAGHPSNIAMYWIDPQP
jgi:hypothetical protein